MERIRHRRVVERSELRDRVPEQDEPLGIRERQRPQQHRVDDGEDRDRRADGDGQRQQGEEREAYDPGAASPEVSVYQIVQMSPIAARRLPATLTTN